MSQNIKYRQLKAFMAVAETGSFKSSADRLAVTQPSFSALIKELEADVGVALVERTTRTCALTEAGIMFHDQIKGPLEHLESAYRELKDVGSGIRGSLTFAVLPSLASGVITDKLGEFQRRYPGVRLTLRERKSGQILDAVRNGEVEFGIGTMLISDPSITFIPLFSDRLMLVVPTGHPLVAMKRVWKALEKFNLVLLTSGLAEQALKVNNVKARQVLEVELSATALAMVRQGMGVSLLPSSIVPALNVDGLELLPIPGKFSTREIGLLHKKSINLSTQARRFVDSLTGISPHDGTRKR